MSTTAETATAIRPFHLEISDDELTELRRRITATRWPSTELVADRSQGVQLSPLQKLARFWVTDYDWRKAEARLNALPQFTTKIDGVEIHFIHVKSAHENALPLIMTHGWPGSVIEFLETVGPLTDPTAHGGKRGGRVRPRAAVDSGLRLLRRANGARLGPRPRSAGMGGADAAPWLYPLRCPGRRRWRERHRRNGPPGAKGSGRHPHELARDGPGRRRAPVGHRRGKAALAALATFRASGFGYFLEQATRPQTIGYALLDSPVALAAWLLDHDTDSYYKISHAFVDGQPAGNLTRDHILDNITLYWLTRTGASAARSYWESGQAQAAAQASGQAPPDVSLPVGFTQFPDEIFRAPRSWVEQSYPNVIYFSKADKGGHFAAWEEPELFSEESPSSLRIAAVAGKAEQKGGSSELRRHSSSTGGRARPGARALRPDDGPRGGHRGAVRTWCLPRPGPVLWVGLRGVHRQLQVLIGLNFAARRSEQLAIGLLFGFGVLIGLGTAPTIAHYASTNPQSVWQAGGATALFIAGFGAAGYATRRDLSGLARACFWALLALIVFGIVTIFVRIPNGALIYSIAGLVIFAGFTAFDFQRLRRTQDIRAAPLLAASIFLDVLNVFLLLLSLFNRN